MRVVPNLFPAVSPEEEDGRDPPFNLILRTAPKAWLTDPALHWYVQLVPRLSRTAGFELGSGIRINTVAPEDAARLLKAG